METARYTIVMLLAGIGIPVLAALNAQLGARIGSPAAAALILFFVAASAAAVMALVTGGLPALPAAQGQPPHLFLAGLLVCFYVLSITWIAPRFGVGNAIFCVLLGQMISAAAIDHFGLFNATVRALTPLRASGIAAMATGLLMVRLG